LELIPSLKIKSSYFSHIPLADIQKWSFCCSDP